ncbi:MAG: DMT family transporter [Ruminococcus sp.]|nr:DMT family transporter [Ruminococcus sp.]
MDKSKFFTRRAVVVSFTLICCLLWGSAFPCIKIGCRLFDIDSGSPSSQILFAGMRFLLAGIMAAAVGSIAARHPLMPSREDIPRVCLLSLFQTILQYTFFYIGLSHTTGMKGSVITASNVFMSILVSALIFRTEKLTARKLVGCTVGFAGVILINLTGSSDLSFSFAGEGMVFLSALSYAFSASITKRFSRLADPIMLSSWQFILGGAFMIAAGLLSGGKVGAAGASGAAMLIYLAFISAAAFSLWSLLLKYNPVSSVSVFGFMNPVFGVILSALLLSERPPAGALRTAAALLLVAVGIITVNSSFIKKEVGTNG